jgi:hypothetical protein
MISFGRVMTPNAGFATLGSPCDKAPTDLYEILVVEGDDMAFTSDVLIKGNCSIKPVIACVEETLGRAFRVESDESGSRFRAVLMGIQIVVFDNPGLEDDRGIAFSEYLIQASFLNFDGSTDQTLLNDLCRIASRIVARAICRTLQYDCIVVEDLQRLIEVLPARPGAPGVERVGSR